MKYWLLKTEPGTFSWDDLEKSAGQQAGWEGVRNYQARNFLLQMEEGDLGFFYHSGISKPAIVGVVRIIRAAYPDPTQFDPGSSYFDPKSTEANPRWFMVDVKLHRRLDQPVLRSKLKENSLLQEMLLFRNTRLSVLPVTENQWEIILRMSEKNG
ncbi:MAG: EVE domain-containing protein [Calditrichia bacterium]